MKLSVIRCCVLVFLWSLAAFAANPTAPAEFTVTENVVWDDIEPIGVNMTKMTGGTNLTTNNFMHGSGMEPAIAKYLIRIERTGPGWIEWDQSKGGIHMWDQNASGFGDGATVRLYRIVDSGGQPLSYSGETRLEDNTGADHVVFLGETTVPAGGWIAEGSEGSENRVYLTNSSIQLAYGDHAIISVKKNILTSDEVHPRLHEWFRPSSNVLNVPQDSSAEIVPHPGTIPSGFEEPGETCLLLRASGTDSGFFGQWLFHAFDNGEGMWYSQLEPGATYRAEAWIRQEGVPGGQVRFACHGPYSTITQTNPWTVTDQWQKFTYDFTGPGYPAPGTWHAAFGIEVMGAGNVWLDNFVVYRYDAEHNFSPLTPHRLAFDELMAAMPATGPKPSLRFYTQTYSGDVQSPMEKLLSNYASSQINFIYNVQAGSQGQTVPIALEWCLATGSSPEDRSVPYLTFCEETTESEWLQLIEYLGVPYDPAVDTPASKPWAYKRYQQRGTGTPWTDEFREIVVEFGNETWHAGVMAGWDGFGRPGWVWHGGREYGLFSRYYFTEHVMAHPMWSQYNLGNKIRFALNAGYDADPDTAYGEVAAKAAPLSTHYLGHANYVGPKWETGETPFQVFDDYGMQETLVGGYLTVFPLLDEIETTRALFQSTGQADYRPIAYEGGPSGYYVPGNGTDEQVAISQLYGKSLGMAVSALDTWLYSSLRGYRHQCYFSYGCGNNWTSHTMPRDGGFRRHTGWLALMMRNLYAPGTEILEVTRQSVPTYERESEDVPLASSYAIRGEDTLSVFVLSRKLDGNHDGVDFGDGSTPVTVHLPFSQCSAITRYALTAQDGSPADPRWSNTEAENVFITSVELDPSIIASGNLVINQSSGGVAGGMPPGTVYLYVFQLGQSPNGDIDGDGDADLEDYSLFAMCHSGLVLPGPADCSNADMDEDGDVTLADFMLFADCFSGPNNPLICP